MTVVSLASGSRGNACCVFASGGAIMIDCGLGPRELKSRAAAAGVDLGLVSGLLLTHSHDDHIRGLGAFHRHFPAVRLFANMMTAEASAWHQEIDLDDFDSFENGQPFDAGPFEISAFSVPHDTSDPVGYLVRADDQTYFHGTDIGTPLDSIGENLAEADIATLESNHDIALLHGSGRPWPLIQRIAGPRGHLSNDQACDLVRRFASSRLRKLRLAHLSQECNAPHIAERAMRETLAGAGLGDVDLGVLSQDCACTF